MPPRALPVSLTRFATAPLIPALPMFANHVLPSRPAQVRSVARPRSISRVAAVVRDRQRVFDAMRDSERAHEVAAGAAVDDGQLDVVGARQPVDHLVHRAVAADRDEELGAARGGFPGEIRQVSRSLRQERVSAQATIGGQPRDLGPSLAGASVVRGRVDQEDGLGANACVPRSRS